MEQLAIYGGKPVREKPMIGPYPGGSVYGAEEEAAVCEVIRRKSPFRYYGENVQGTVHNFERMVSDYFEIPYVHACSSGTAAVILALIGIGVEPGDRIVVPANTFYATASASIFAGGIPVYCDVDHSMNIDPDALEKILAGGGIKAAIVVPILGNPCQMERIAAMCKHYGVYLIEDAAQAMGSRYRGALTGTFGDVSTFSLQINKIITAGEGGLVLTRNPVIYERVVRFHDQGMFRDGRLFPELKDQKPICMVGVNFRMSEVAGALACAQMRKIDYIVGHMHEIKYRVKAAIQPEFEAMGVEFRTILDADGDASNSLIMYMPTPEKAKAFIHALLAENIHCDALYNGKPIYAAPALMNKSTPYRCGYPFNLEKEPVVYAPGMCPVAEDILSRNVILQMAAGYSDADAEDIIHGVLKVARVILAEGEKEHVE